MEKKNQYQKFPIWIKVLGYFIVIILATYITEFVPVLDNIFYYFGVAFILSWLMLRTEGNTLASLGFIPKGSIDWRNFLAGLGIGILMLILTAWITIWFSGNRLELSGHMDPAYLLILIAANFWSSFVQEFTYRGYPFQTMLSRYGAWPAQLSIIIPFGVMHLNLNTQISFEQIVVTVLTTGLGSVLYGLAYIKTKKLFLPIGLHMGWNLAQAIIPRAPQESKTRIFTLVQGNTAYNPWVILLPYIVITLIAILLIQVSKKFDT